jgi:hypothetical protein
LKVPSQKDSKEDLGNPEIVDDEAENDDSLLDVSNIIFDQDNMHDVMYGTPYFPILRCSPLEE